MKRKNIIIVLLVVVVIFLYIGISSTAINKDYYRKLAWELTKQDKTIIDWKSGQVSVVSVSESPIHVAHITSAKINYSLLFLNGNRVVRVEFQTTQDGQLGPSVLYFNPFTKQCIGGEIRR